MLTTIDPSLLASVSGGFDEAQLRSWAQESCPTTYRSLAHKPISKITRADADRCVAEAKPGFFTRGLIESQLDSYFGAKKK